MFMLLWVLVTACSAVALLAILAFDEWQVRSRAAVPAAPRSEARPTGRVPELA